MIDPDLLNILACPETGQELEIAGTDIVDKINRKISEGKAINKAGKKVTVRIDGGLLRKGDRSVLYPIREGIPILLIEERIALE